MTRNKFYYLWLLGAVFLLSLFFVWQGYWIKSARVNAYLVEMRGAAQVKPAVEQVVLPEGISQADIALGQKQNRRFVELLGQLDSITPKSILFQSLSYDNNANTIRMRGVALKVGGGNEISQYIVALKKDNQFQSIDLSSLRDSSIPSAYDFELTCKLKTENM